MGFRYLPLLFLAPASAALAAENLANGWDGTSESAVILVCGGVLLFLASLRRRNR